MVKVAPTPTVRSAVIQATEQRLRPLELTHPLTPSVSAEQSLGLLSDSGCCARVRAIGDASP